MTELLKDRRGDSMVTYVLILPLFILIVFGALQVWRIVSIKQSLYMGTYQTVRCLSMYDSRNTTRDECQRLLEAQLTRNGLIGENAEFRIAYSRWDPENDRWLAINDPTTPEIPECGIPFRMEVVLSLPRSVVIPYLPERDMTLHERKSSYIECPRGSWAPPSEGTPITPLN